MIPLKGQVPDDTGTYSDPKRTGRGQLIYGALKFGACVRSIMIRLDGLTIALGLTV